MSQPAHAFDNQPNQPPLLATKTFIPRAREGLVSRPHLLGRLDAALGCALTLVSAPAGFGKTTLLAEWLHNRPHRACWLSLDAGDNDPPRFLAYVIAALQQALPAVAGDLAAHVRSPQPPSVEAVVATLVNELAGAAGHVTLVLDDYHAITAPPVNAALSFLLENLPPNVHVVVATRSDLPIPVARLRSRGQLLELRADDLRFTNDEAAAFLGQTMGLALSPAQVAALDERTEGWIAGLQMAALSMRGRDDADGFIRAFAGTNRFILDFLVEEVLSREPAEVQNFLLQTAVLNRLSGPLCDAVTGATGGQTMLERLERRNLFVAPLDDERRVYRYHHLFADLLKARLHGSGAGEVARLQARAAEWCEREGQFAEAVGYALAARDYERATGLIVRHWPQVSSTGEIETVWSWLQALPEDAVRDSAPLGVAYCWLLWLQGRLEPIEERLILAERAFAGLAAPEGAGPEATEHAALATQLAALRSIVACYRDDFDTAVEFAERSLGLMPANLPPEANGQLRTVVYLALASAYEGVGDLARAAEAFGDTIRWSRLGRSGTGMAVTFLLAKVLRPLGRLRAADEACREALRFVEEQGMAGLPAAGVLHVAMSEVLLERDDLAGAEAQLARGMELGQHSGRLDAAHNAAYVLVRLRQARHDANGALAAVEEVEASLSGPSPMLRAELLALKATVLVRQRAVSEAAKCVAEARKLAAGDRGVTGETVALAAARVMAAQRAPAEAVEQLTRYLAAAERRGRWGTAIEVLTLRALALGRLGDRQGAEADLERALGLAEPEGYVRLFVEEGEPLAAQLRAFSARRTGARASGGPSAAYLARLLAAFDVPGGDGGASARSLQAMATLVEPISERELEVLRLLAEGLTNEQIASRLVIALGTAKTHVHNLSAKLGAQNRSQAVARARELRLL